MTRMKLTSLWAECNFPKEVGNRLGGKRCGRAERTNFLKKFQGNFRIDQCRVVLTNSDSGARLSVFESHPFTISVTLDELTFNLSCRNEDNNCTFHSGCLCRAVRIVPGTE